MTTNDDKREEGKQIELPSFDPPFWSGLRLTRNSDSERERPAPRWVISIQRCLYTFQKTTIFGFLPKKVFSSKVITFVALGFMAIGVPCVYIFPDRLRGLPACIVGVGVAYFFFQIYWTLFYGTAYTMIQAGVLRPNDEKLSWDIITPDQSAQDTTPPDSIETRLQRLEGLKEKGLLTDAEYQAKREEILGEV